MTDPVRVRGARWSSETAQRDDILTLTADAREAPTGTGRWCASLNTTIAGRTSR